MKTRPHYPTKKRIVHRDVTVNQSRNTKGQRAAHARWSTLEIKAELKVWSEQSLKTAHSILCNTKGKSRIHHGSRELGCHGRSFITMT
jgi:hypothetical protein